MQKNMQQITEGIVEYQNGYLEFSCQRIEISVVPNSIYEGTFKIKTSDGKTAEGTITTSDYRFQCKEEKIYGSKGEIPFSFDAFGLENGQIVTGNVILISNYGEHLLPFSVRVELEQVSSTLGDIKNLFHFANLAKSDWDEAVWMFYSPDFIKLFQVAEKQYLSAYEGFCKIPGNESNLEEFLIEVNKKNPIHYKIEENSIYIDGYEGIQDFDITLSRSGWGYTYLEIRTVGEFFYTNEEIITKESFAGNCARLHFRIDENKLHDGLNSGKVIISNINVHLEIPITVEKTRAQEKKNRILEEKKCILECMSIHEEYRLHKFSKDTWLRHSRRLVNRLMEIDVNNDMYQLLHIQLLMEEERVNEAEWEIKRLMPHMETKKNDTVIYGYFLYLSTLYNREPGYVSMVTEIIARAYNREPWHWQLAWFLCYLDEEMTVDTQKKWNFLEEQFRRGCTSPILYLEVLQMVFDRPSIIRKLDSFEENILWYAIKNDVLTSELVDQIQYVADKKKTFSERTLKILISAYEKFAESSTLTVLCSYLIKGNKIGKEYFKWYALGVEKNLRVTRLYDYYMMSMELPYKGKIPKMIMMYFSYQADLDYEHTAFLYAYIMRHADKYPEIARSYEKHIQDFVVEHIKQGHVNEDLAYLYQKFVTDKILKDECAYAFVPLLFMNEVTVDNDEITSIVLIHEKVVGESSYPVENKKVLLPIYGSEYKILLQDAFGNRFTKSIGYVVRQLMKPEVLIDSVAPFIEGRLGFDLYLCQTNRNYVSIDAQNVKRFKNLTESEQIEESYKKDIRTKLLHYYYDNDMISELDLFLDEIEPERMDSDERAEFIQFLISRGMFEKAFEWSREYGVEKVKLKTLARLISKCIMSNQFYYDSFLVSEAFRIFQNGKYDENILTYLIRHYAGRVQELRTIWKAAEELGLGIIEIVEKIIKQMMVTGSYVGEKADIFMHYYAIPEHNEQVCYAFATCCAYEYFVMDEVMESKFVEYMISRYLKEDKINKPCMLAMLKYFAQNPDQFGKLSALIAPKLVNSFTREDIYFPFFQQLIPLVPELEHFGEEHFVEYKTRPDSRVWIRYMYLTRDDDGEYITEEMKDMYCGVHIKLFHLFAGESVQYYIIENVDGKEQIVASAMLGSEEYEFGEGEGRFHMINDLIIGIQQDDYKTVDSMLKEYSQKKYLTEELFQIVV